MSNYVTYKAAPGFDTIQMSNGLTTVFIATLVLAASELAQTERERRFALWLAAHDQTICGRGCVGFDLSELPWSSEGMTDERPFVLRVIDAAKAHTGWQRLGYQPREDWVQNCLTQFRAMVQAFDAAHITTSMTTSLYEPPPLVAQCTVHRVYHHAYGCVLCNDQ